jgi:hypothetical protein
MIDFTAQLIDDIYGVLDINYIGNELKEICFFYVLNEVIKNPEYLKFIIQKYNFYHLLIPSPFEHHFEVTLPSYTPFTLKKECARLFGHELTDVIISIQNKLSCDKMSQLQA